MSEADNIEPRKVTQYCVGGTIYLELDARGRVQVRDDYRWRERDEIIQLRDCLDLYLADT